MSKETRWPRVSRDIHRFMFCTVWVRVNSGQVFHELICPLTVILPQISFNLTKLFSYPVFSCLVHVPLGVIVHFLVLLRSSRFESFLPRFSPFITQVTNFCSDPGFILLTIFAKSLFVFEVVITECVSASALFMVRDLTTVR